MKAFRDMEVGTACGTNRARCELPAGFLQGAVAGGCQYGD